MADPVLRQWALLRALPRYPRKVTAQHLSDRLAEEGFKVHLRTVQRDLNNLATLFPIAADEQEHPFGWFWSGEAVFDLPGMDAATALAFELTGQFLTALWPRGAFRELTPYIRRAEQVLEGVDREGLRSWKDKVRLLPRGLKLHHPAVSADVLDGVYQALLEERRFEVDYCPRGQDEVRSYKVNPLALVYRDGVLYLVATLWAYTNTVHLALHRMDSVSLLEEGIRWPEGFDLDSHIAEGGFRYPESGELVHLQALFAPEAAYHLYETPLSTDQALRETEEGVEVAATVQDTQELRWWLLGFGANVRVLGPEALVEEMADVAERMAAAYGTG